MLFPHNKIKTEISNGIYLRKLNSLGLSEKVFKMSHSIRWMANFLPVRSLDYVLAQKLNKTIKINERYDGE